MTDPTVSRFVVRDADARLDKREKEAVDQWIDSDAGVHIMRDHPNHKWEIMGGMWGSKQGIIPTFKEDLLRYYNNPPTDWFTFRGQGFFSYDQKFLKDCLWPHILNNHMAHDEFYKPLGNELSFPIKRLCNTHFVGQKYTEDDVAAYSI